MCSEAEIVDKDYRVNTYNCLKLRYERYRARIICTHYFFSSPLRYLVTPTAKNLLPVFDGLSWKSLEKRSKFPHLSIEGECKISVFLFPFYVWWILKSNFMM